VRLSAILARALAAHGDCAQARDAMTAAHKSRRRLPCGGLARGAGWTAATRG
jgi:hypothetical protein